MAPGGRKHPPIVSSNFTIIEKKNDKSNRYWLQCNHCPGDSDRLQNRDNKHIKHLADAKQCPNAPSEVRKQALIYLAGKNAGDSIFVSASHTSPAQTDSDATSAVDATTAVVPIKKRKSGTLAGMVDYPLSEAQKARADVKLFHFVVHANVPFSVSENFFFRDFLNEIRPLYEAPSRYVLSHSIMDAENLILNNEQPINHTLRVYSHKLIQH